MRYNCHVICNTDAAFIAVFHWPTLSSTDGLFEAQKSGNKTSSKEIGLNIRTLASPKMRQNQMPR